MTENRTQRPKWNAAEYHRLAHPHVSWGRSVLARLPLAGNETVVDAGCGSGRLTSELLEMLPEGRVIAVDLSANMLAEARRQLEPLAAGRVSYLQADLQTLAVDEPVDAIFSTAALHWVPDHQLMFEHFYRALKPGGWLVAQCGGGPNIANVLEHAREIMRSERFAYYFAGWDGPWEFANPGETEARLRRAGFERIATSLAASPVTLSGPDEYRDYIETVVFVTHLSRLPDDAIRAEFLDRLTSRAAGEHPPFSLEYWRLNIRARRPEQGG